MKRMVKVMAAVMLVAAMVLSIASCGVDMNKIKGDWHLSTINGQSVADFAAANGVAEVFAQKAYNITDKTLTVGAIGPDGTVINDCGDVTVRANGIESTISGVVFGFEYKDADQTLNYTVTDGTNTYSYVLVKGAYDLAGEYAKVAAAAQGSAEEGGSEVAGSEDAGSEEGGEEYYEDDGESYEE